MSWKLKIRMQDVMSLVCDVKFLVDYCSWASFSFLNRLFMRLVRWFWQWECWTRSKCSKAWICKSCNLGKPWFMENSAIFWKVSFTLSFVELLVATLRVEGSFLAENTSIGMIFNIVESGLGKLNYKYSFWNNHYCSYRLSLKLIPLPSTFMMYTVWCSD